LNLIFTRIVYPLFRASPTKKTEAPPFILRGVTLAGVDSNTALIKDRLTGWKRLDALISESDLHQLLMATIALEDIESVCQAKIRGEAPGNFLVDLSR